MREGPEGMREGQRECRAGTLWYRLRAAVIQSRPPLEVNIFLTRGLSALLTFSLFTLAKAATLIQMKLEVTEAHMDIHNLYKHSKQWATIYQLIMLTALRLMSLEVLQSLIQTLLVDTVSIVFV